MQYNMFRSISYRVGDKQYCTLAVKRYAYCKKKFSDNAIITIRTPFILVHCCFSAEKLQTVKLGKRSLWTVQLRQYTFPVFVDDTITAPPFRLFVVFYRTIQSGNHSFWTIIPFSLSVLTRQELRFICSKNYGTIQLGKHSFWTIYHSHFQFQFGLNYENTAFEPLLPLKIIMGDNNTIITMIQK